MIITNQTVKQTLLQIKDIIKDPTNWTQKAYARNQAGKTVDILDKNATCFCLAGAVEKVILSDGDNEVDNSYACELFDKVWDKLTEAISIITNTPVERCRMSEYNDTHTHAEALALIDKAIQLCE